MYYFSVESDDGTMLSSPLGAINSEDTGAVNELDSTTLTLKTGQKAFEVVTLGRMNLVSKEASESLASTY